MTLHRLLTLGLRATLAAAIALGAATDASALEKRGVGIADRSAPERVDALAPGWYYTWSPFPESGPVKAEFVPMVWGGTRLDEHVKAVAGMRPRPAYLLTMNEPDQGGQANMSVQDAVAAWPRVADLAEHVGLPATATPGNAWQDRFVEIAQRQHLRGDFIALHVYGPPDPAKFLHKVDATWQKYHLPIWITEFAVADWDAKDKPGANRYPEAEVLRFMKAVLPELERRDYVQRYAWYGAGKGSVSREALRTSRLFEADGSLSELGRFYATFHGGR